MPITTTEEAKASIKAWLTENGHTVNEIDDDKSDFHFEVDYPAGTIKRSRIIKPKTHPGLCVLLNGVAIAEEHKKKLEEMDEDERDIFYNKFRKEMIFLENSYEMDTDENGVVGQIQFTYEFYFDALTKTQLFKGLLLNHRTLLYIIMTFNEQFGLPEMPPQDQDPSQTVQ